MRHMIITLDGPAGTGKSTVARAIARELGFLFLDTGALYRAAALALDRSGVDMANDAGWGAIVSKSDIQLKDNVVTLDGEDVSAEIRSARITQMSSLVAASPVVREALLGVQRRFAECQSLVAEGRDTGSVVFPKADIKFYLDAAPEERARRRYVELKQKGRDIGLEEVLADIKERDKRDASRDHAPLCVPDHAVVVDTTHMSQEDVTKKLLNLIRDNLAD